jgi:hypothetical protein
MLGDFHIAENPNIKFRENLLSSSQVMCGQMDMEACTI